MNNKRSLPAGASRVAHRAAATERQGHGDKVPSLEWKIARSNLLASRVVPV